MGKQRRNPWNVLLFFLVIVIVAYLCKRGWDGFYNTPGVWVSTQFIQLIHGQHWWTWDVPIPTADGIYSCVADAGDGRKIMWTCTVSGGEYTVSGLSKQGNVCDIRLNFSATITPGGSPSTTSAYGFPSYPSRHRPAYFGIDFWYCSPAGANYVLTVTQIYPPPVAPVAAAAQAAPPPSAPPPASMGVYSLYNVGSAPGNYDWNASRSGNYPIGSGVQWIWNFPASDWSSNQQIGVPISFYINYNNTGGTINATVMAGFDDNGNIKINSTNYGPFSASVAPFQVTLNPGNNTIQLTVINGGGPAGLWFAIRDNTGRILLKTDSTSGWSLTPLPPPAAPGYMPPQEVNRNRVRRTKTCSTCPSAPLLSSLPTPSIAHNVNLPHYCQRLTDDGGI